MRYFLDTEFIEDGKGIDLISIALVSEQGNSFYACNTECNLSKANQWVRDNVLPHLPPASDRAWMSRQQIVEAILQFVGPEPPEFWGYFADYDWVVFCQLFGTMADLPKHFPMYCRDIAQLADFLGNPELPQLAGIEHRALDDALDIKAKYEFLISFQEVQAALNFAQSPASATFPKI